MEPERPLRKYIEAALLELSLPPQLAEQHGRLLDDLAHFTLRWAQRINLTGFQTPQELVERLILPPFAWLEHLPAKPSCIADLGSGAGFPGIPLALAFPAARVLLIDARERRNHFQRAACRKLPLANVQPILGRVETLPASPCDLVVAQALARPRQAARLMRRWARPGAMLAIPIGLGASLPDASDLIEPRVVEYSIHGAAVPGHLWCARLAS